MKHISPDEGGSRELEERRLSVSMEQGLGRYIHIIFVVCILMLVVLVLVLMLMLRLMLVLRLPGSLKFQRNPHVITNSLEPKKKKYVE